MEILENTKKFNFLKIIINRSHLVKIVNDNLKSKTFKVKTLPIMMVNIYHGYKLTIGKKIVLLAKSQNLVKVESRVLKLRNRIICIPSKQIYLT